MEKRSISFVLLFVFLIFLLEFVSSATCSVTTSCNQDNLVMKLYSEINSHGALYDAQVPYNYYLCCDFTGTHTCDESNLNTILKLSAPYNAHAEKRSESTYTSPVCFGNLTCTSTTGSCNNDFPIPMVSLSAETNAHIAKFDYSYPYKICCAFATSLFLCGDKTVDEVEECDDGNPVSGDGCSYPGCTIEDGWTCKAGDPSICYLTNPETKWLKNGEVPRRGYGLVKQRNPITICIPRRGYGISSGQDCPADENKTGPRGNTGRTYGANNLNMNDIQTPAQVGGGEYMRKGKS